MPQTKLNPRFNGDDLLTVLQDHIGKNNGIRADALARQLSGSPLSQEHYQRQVRKLVLSLRNEGHHICATPQHGYFIAKDEAELNETCEFLYDRALSSLEQISAMKKVSVPDFRGQLRLDT